jgi:hypothetical protein
MNAKPAGAVYGFLSRRGAELAVYGTQVALNRVDGQVQSVRYLLPLQAAGNDVHGGVTLCTNCREEVFSETHIQTLESLSSATGAKRGFES